MPRWLWWTPLALLVLGFALVGLRYGWIAATITETDVINRYAARYIKERGGDAALADCVAYPGQAGSGIWLVVRCTPDAGEPATYRVNRLGGLEQGAARPPAPQEPQT
ncbi:MAG: hypothetical protein HKN30_14740 [Sulfitobacter sp.]|nr:hypothetical protein [Sulfitobacter sp.]